jgi:hypothetical protein
LGQGVGLDFGQKLASGLEHFVNAVGRQVINPVLKPLFPGQFFSEPVLPLLEFLVEPGFVRVLLILGGRARSGIDRACPRSWKAQ